MMYVLEINERPTGKERPKFNLRTKAVYTPTKTVQFEDFIKWKFIEKYKNVEVSEKPFKLSINAFFKPSKTAIKNKIDLIGKLYTNKPDLDNIEKIIMDSFNGVVYRDDSQVAEKCGSKRYGERDKIIIVLEELE